MTTIDQADFAFDPRVGLGLGLMTAVMVFGVALDLRWDHFRQVFRSPKAPLIGLAAQFVVLPVVVLVICRALVDTPSIALGLALVACCPGGSISNYLTHLARGNVATSVTITALTTASTLVTTPLVFGLLASANPDTRQVLKEIGINPVQLVLVFVITIGLPTVGGMWLAVRRPGLSSRIRPWARRVSLVFFALFAGTAIALNLDVLIAHTGEALLPVAVSCVLALVVGWGLARLVGLRPPDRRAVTIEAGGQHVGLAIALAVTFFPTLAGAAVTGAMYGAVQILLIIPMVTIWSRIPPGAEPGSDSRAAEG